MENRYSFLSDPRALAEIRKHKWIESQKKNEEVSFAFAALDWIKKYGESWKRIHVKKYKDYRVFIERRKFRRFNIDCPVVLKNNEINFSAWAKEISFFGLLCKSSDYLNPGSKIFIELPEQACSGKRLFCETTVDRVSRREEQRYEFFLRFDSLSQEMLADFYRNS